MKTYYLAPEAFFFKSSLTIQIFLTLIYLNWTLLFHIANYLPFSAWLRNVCQKKIGVQSKQKEKTREKLRKTRICKYSWRLS